MPVHARRKQLTKRPATPKRPSRQPDRPGRTSTTTPEGIAANDPEATAFPGEGLPGGGFVALNQDLMIAIEACHPHPDNRTSDENDPDLIDLAGSIRELGQRQAILVRRPPPGSKWHGMAAGEYQIVFGERRWRACRLAGLNHVRAKVTTDLNDAQTLVVMATENGLRKDLNPIERARHGRLLVESARMKREEAARVVGLESPAALTNLMALLDLPEQWQDRVAAGDLPPSWAQRIVPVRQAAPVMQSLELDWANRETVRDTGTFESRRRLEDAIKELLWQKLREINDRKWLDSLSDQDREKLGLFEMSVADGRGKQRETLFATNVLLVDRLASSGGTAPRPPREPAAAPGDVLTPKMLRDAEEAGRVAARNGAPPLKAEPPKSATHDRSFEPPETAGRSASPAAKIEGLIKACELVVSWLSNVNICEPQEVLDRVCGAMIEAGYPAHALERVKLDGAASIGRATLHANGRPKAAKKKAAKR